MVSAWNVGELDTMILPPCHYGFQVWTRELSYSERYKIWFNNNYETGMEYYEGNVPNFDDDYYEPTPTRAISLMWNQRSVDTFLGLPFNIASYGLLLHIIANEVNMVADELIGNFGDVHLYSNHIEQAKEQIGRTSFDLPKLKTDAKIDGICCNVPDDFILEGYQHHPTIKAPLSN
jgi:thymidylate synthase